MTKAEQHVNAIAKHTNNDLTALAGLTDAEFDAVTDACIEEWRDDGIPVGAEVATTLDEVESFGQWYGCGRKVVDGTVTSFYDVQLFKGDTRKTVVVVDCGARRVVVKM